MNFWKIDSRDKVKQILDNLAVNLIDKWDFTKPVRIEVKPYTNPRSLSQNALLHVWLDDITKGLKIRNFTYDLDGVDTYLTSDDVKLMMKHKFLGVKDIVRGKLVIPDQLRNTSDLDKGEMLTFMNDVYGWAVDRGIQLNIPEESEYMRLSRENG